MIFRKAGEQSSMQVGWCMGLLGKELELTGGHILRVTVGDVAMQVGAQKGESCR